MEDGNLRTENSSFEYPSNIEAEQALLGTLLLNNDSFDRIREVISEDHFFDPVHSKIFELIASKIQKNSSLYCALVVCLSVKNRVFSCGLQLQ